MSEQPELLTAAEEALAAMEREACGEDAGINFCRPTREVNHSENDSGDLPDIDFSPDKSVARCNLYERQSIQRLNTCPVSHNGIYGKPDVSRWLWRERKMPGWSLKR